VTLEDRIESARDMMLQVILNWENPDADEATDAVLKAFAPELFTVPPTGWIAPVPRN
jgi:hypothetical protein